MWRDHSVDKALSLIMAMSVTTQSSISGVAALDSLGPVVSIFESVATASLHAMNG